MNKHNIMFNYFVTFELTCVVHHCLGRVRSQAETRLEREACRAAGVSLFSDINAGIDTTRCDNCLFRLKVLFPFKYVCLGE